MKKFFLLSSISVFIGLISLVFYSNQAYAMPPFEVPPAGGFPACTADLDTCTGDLGTCDDNLIMCTGELVACDGFVDNGDGTVTDVRSGLMWEIKTLVMGSVHFGNNTYDWSTNSVDPNGTLFMVFLDTLNNKCDGDETTSCATDANCTDIGNGLCGHAGFRDWRIPEVFRDSGSYELESIVSLTQGQCGGGGGPCISPVFGLTRNVYWSATEISGTSSAWAVAFSTGDVGNGDKSSSFSARAVRRP